MTDATLHPRYLLPRLTEALADTPVVLIHGQRQCGKTTLALQVGGKAGYTYISFDDDVRSASAEADPVGFVAELADKVVLRWLSVGHNIFLAASQGITIKNAGATIWT